DDVGARGAGGGKHHRGNGGAGKEFRGIHHVVSRDGLAVPKIGSALRVPEAGANWFAVQGELPVTDGRAPAMTLAGHNSLAGSRQGGVLTLRRAALSLVNCA